MPQLRLLPYAEVVDTVEDAVVVLEQLMRRGGKLAIDSETTGLDLMRERILFWSMATEDRRIFLTPDVMPVFDTLFRRRDITWIFADAKYDMHMFANHGYFFAGDIWDIVVMDALEDDTRPHGLKAQAKNSYGIAWGDFRDLFIKPKRVAESLSLDRESMRRFKTMSGGEKLLFVYDERPELVVDYASCDAFFTYMRAMDLAKRLDAELLATEMFSGFNTLFDYFQVIEKPFTKVLWKMERRGVTVDLDYTKKIDRPMREGITAAKNAVCALARNDINPSADDQVRPRG